MDKVLVVKARLDLLVHFIKDLSENNYKFTRFQKKRSIKIKEFFFLICLNLNEKIIKNKAKYNSLCSFTKSF